MDAIVPCLFPEGNYFEDTGNVKEWGKTVDHDQVGDKDIR